MTLNIQWHNNLSYLADSLFSDMAGRQKATEPDQVLTRRDCIVIPNHIMLAWLRQHYLYPKDTTNEPRVFANCDFKLLNIFVNEWLHKMQNPNATRDPRTHPFSTEALRWRIHKLLADNPNIAGQIMSSQQPASGESNSNTMELAEDRRFKLAARLAVLFDQYMVYRPEMLSQWEQGQNPDLPENLQWQPELWRLLVKDNVDKTYLAAFKHMAGPNGQTSLQNSGIADFYQSIYVFGVSMMPKVYLWFFHQLAKRLNVKLFLFNPCREDWFIQPSPRQMPEAFAVEATDESDPEPPPNMLLASLGKGSREFLCEALEVSDGQAAEFFGEERNNSLLHSMQTAILLNQNELQPENAAQPDSSIMINACHGPMREVQILRDHILRWFGENPGLQPRHIQVQAPDITEYAPFIDAVFSTRQRLAASTIPYVIADRTQLGESSPAKAFFAIPDMVEGRFTLPEIIELLHCENIARTFKIQADDIPNISSWLEAAGVRWGFDVEHRTQIVEKEFTPQTSWRHGLDRLFLGFAMGDQPENPSHPDPNNRPMPCNAVNDGMGDLLGYLADFVIQLKGTISELKSGRRTPGEWKEKLTNLLNTFFVGIGDSYLELFSLRAAVAAMEKTANAAGFNDEIPLRIARQFIASGLQSITDTNSMHENAVVFNTLRPGSSTTRKIICLMGMGDSLFPRPENRPAYDLFRIKRKQGDRSERIEGRAAWLEAIAAAEEKLYISFVGFDASDLTKVPPSILVNELLEQTKNNVLPINHKLRAFDPAYFNDTSGNGRFFSFSRRRCQAAQVILDNFGAKHSKPIEKASPILSDESAYNPTDHEISQTGTITLAELIRFFNNPAEWYYRNAVMANIKIPESLPDADSENFETDSLEDYHARQPILEAMLALPSEQSEDDITNTKTALCKRLTEVAMIPLEQHGVEWLEAQWDEIHELLQAHIEGFEAQDSLKNILARQRESRPQPLEAAITLGDTSLTITGSIVSRQHGADTANSAFDFWLASAKPKYIIASWITHLFACAAGIQETRYCIATKKLDDKDKTVVFFPHIEPERARENLAEFVRGFIVGRKAILPFTPATSWAYAEKAATDVAMGEARKAWFSESGYTFKDDQDAFFAKAFGQNGPFGNSFFPILANKLLKPIFEQNQMQKVKLLPTQNNTTS